MGSACTQLLEPADCVQRPGGPGCAGNQVRHLHAARGSHEASLPHQPSPPASASAGGTWRFRNVTLMCTGPATHPAQHKLRGLLLSGPAYLRATTAACAIAAAWWRRRSRNFGKAAALLLVASWEASLAFAGAGRPSCSRCLRVGMDQPAQLLPLHLLAGSRLPNNLLEVAAARERGVLIAERIGRGALLGAVRARPTSARRLAAACPVAACLCHCNADGAMPSPVLHPTCIPSWHLRCLALNAHAVLLWPPGALCRNVWGGVPRQAAAHGGGCCCEDPGGGTSWAMPMAGGAGHGTACTQTVTSQELLQCLRSAYRTQFWLPALPTEPHPACSSLPRSTDTLGEWFASAASPPVRCTPTVWPHTSTSPSQCTTSWRTHAVPGGALCRHGAGRGTAANT